MMSNDFLAAALSPMCPFNRTIVSNEEYLEEVQNPTFRGSHFNCFNPQFLHDSEVIKGPVQSDVVKNPKITFSTCALDPWQCHSVKKDYDFTFPIPTAKRHPSDFIIIVKTLSTNKTMELKCDPSDAVEKIKYKIERRQNIPRHEQRLFFDGEQLGDGHTLASFNIQHDSIIHVMYRLGGGRACLYLPPENFRSPQFDYDFSNLDDTKDGLDFIRGTLPYKRPCGWYRIALNVDRFGHDKAWLGPLNRKIEMEWMSREWPGSYEYKQFYNLSESLYFVSLF
jgi:hypothetical protein